jgi:homoserine O-acetyltransferase/O-succinyltransferase
LARQDNDGRARKTRSRMMQGPSVAFFNVPDFLLECGVRLPEARLAYRIDGERSDAAPILTCTAFSRLCDDMAYLSNAGGALDPGKRWIIRTEMLGNGRSSSPSNTPAPFHGPDFPALTQRDNIALQKVLLDYLGVDRVHAVIGGSMGGQQAIQWAVSHPGIIARAVVIVGQARTSWHGQLFLRAMEEALASDPAFAGGRYVSPPVEGLKRMSRAWAPWALSPRFFSRGLYRNYPDTEAATLDGFLAKWETRYLGKDANDLVAHLRCWMGHDVTKTPGKPISIAAIGKQTSMPILFLPCDTDAYFNAADICEEAAHFPNAQVKVIRSDYGHAAGFARAAEDAAFVDAAIAEFLEG